MNGSVVRGADPGSLSAASSASSVLPRDSRLAGSIVIVMLGSVIELSC
jgi:hypothetical protein